MAPKHLGNIETGAGDGPVEFGLDGTTMQAVPALPADDFGKFSKITTNLTKIADSLKGEKDPDKVAELLDQFVRAALDGLGMILLDESLTIVSDRVSDRNKPLDVPNLVKIFMLLVKHYNQGEDGDKPGEDGAPFDGDNASSPGSATPTTGNEPEATSSAEGSTSEPGPTTTSSTPPSPG